jgi:hypothetical protein
MTRIGVFMKLKLAICARAENRSGPFSWRLRCGDAELAGAVPDFCCN